MNNDKTVKFNIYLFHKYEMLFMQERIKSQKSNCQHSRYNSVSCNLFRKGKTTETIEFGMVFF